MSGLVTLLSWQIRRPGAYDWHVDARSEVGSEPGHGLPAPNAPAVLVVGMHRSGTSAMTSALGALGLVLPRPEDEMGPRRGNDRGHFESLSLVEQSDDLLRRLGGAWDDPPPMPPDPISSDELRGVAERAAEAFRLAFDDPTRAVCWKDPRTALLLPFWRQVIDRPLAVVFCVRHPLEVARSLERRDALELPVGLALWERYQYRALAGLSGLPVYVTAFADALEEPDEWRRDVRSWLVALPIAGLEGDEGATGGSDLGFDPDLRHERIAGSEQHAIRRRSVPRGEPDVRAVASIVLASQLALYEEILGLRGPHASFDHVLSTVESPWAACLLDQRRDAVRMWSAVDWLGEELADRLDAPGAGETEPVAPPRGPYPPNVAEDYDSYAHWLRGRGEPLVTSNATAAEVAAAGGTPTRTRAGHGSGRPLFSVVVPCFRTPLGLLDRCVASVLAQNRPDWELWLCDDGSGDASLGEKIGELAALDERIRTVSRAENGGISAATNDAVALATGRYLVFLDHDDEIHPSALDRIAAAIAEHPEADLLYSDEDKIDDAGRRFAPAFKPDWSPDLLLSQAYMCHLLVVRRDLVTKLGGLDSEFDGAQDYDLMLRVTETTSDIVHIPEVLYHWRTTEGSASGDAGAKPWAFEAGRRALEAAAERRGFDAVVVQHPKVPGSYHVIRRPSSGYLVSAIIPFRDEPALTAACYRSFIERPGYDNFELLLVDNDSALPETRALLEDLARDHRVRLLRAPGAFDWAAINNEAAGKRRGDLLLLLNNDIEARSDGWLAAMVAQAERPEVGAVGARLIYPDGTIQHAGVVVGSGFGATHVQQGLRADRPGYMALTTVTRNTSAVTGACLMTRASVFEELGGLDTNFPIAYNDIDYCLRARAKGLLVVYAPLAELIHHESKSRGHSDDTGEIPFFQNRWRSLLLSGDPYYNSNLGRFDNNCRLPNEEEEAKWEIFLSMLSESSTN